MTASSQSLPSPDGSHIATVLPSKLTIRETRSLEIIRVVSLPSELSASISWFLWSASSTRLLLGSAENIRVYSIIDPQFSANVTNLTSGTTKVVHVAFGSTENEVLLFSEFGLKLSVIDLRAPNSVDINAPKLYTSGLARKGLSYRPLTGNLALLTRHSGKDVISIHNKHDLEVLRSWNPETVDAQGLTWSPDGRWLVVWESAAHGHRALVYTADGHLFKHWNGPTPILEEGTDIALGPGIKLYDWAKTGTHVAVGDYSKRVTVLSAPLFTEPMSLFHATSVKPTESLQIWHEQITPLKNGGYDREFVQATQITCPPTGGSLPPSSTEAKTGTNILTFDNSGSLLATRTESMPTTLWIWDVSTRNLRAVMIFHAPIATVTWHPSVDELLLVRCEGEESRGLVHVWDPSWEAPKVFDFLAQLAGGKVIGKTIARWLNATSSPAIFFSDSQDSVLASLISTINEGDESLPWQDAEVRGFDIYGRQEESPFALVSADESRRMEVSDMVDDSDGLTTMSEYGEDVEDTFRFRKFLQPVAEKLS